MVKDQQTIQYGYNWTLRQQTEKIVDPEGLKIKSMSAYDKETGLPTEIRQPKDEKAAGSGTTKFIYYKKASASPGACEKDIYAGLLCKEEPAVQPTGRDLPVIYYAKYNSLGQPQEVVESVTTPSAATRKVVMTYDSAGRAKTREVVGGDATQVPKVETAYNSTTGLPVTLQFVCPVAEPSCDKQTTTTTYDALGRAFEYQDADGVTSKAGFDVNGRMISVYDGKGSQTISYDGASGLPVQLTDSMAGTFTASYDPDGRMVQQSLPNGLSAALTVDSSGAPTALTYTKSSNCGTSCTWLNFEVTRSASGRVLTEAGTLGSRSFSYDGAGRLEKAQETPPSGGCTTRVYAFDPNSNRTSKITRNPGVGGVCTESGGTAQAYSYDSADRLNSSGVVYDLFGRVTTLPASLAGGGNLQTSYFSTGMVASQTQGGVTNTFGLDASMRQRQRVQAGGLQGVEVFHYSSGSDSPAWTQIGETWTRNIMGIGGSLTAIAKSGSGTRLQLANLHGDIVATASADPAVSQLEMTARTDEFGVPLSGTPQRYGWLGGSARRTELASGVIQMGARSYVPTIGKFLSRDPIAGGSATAYDYGNADPVNQFDPTGMEPYGYDSDCDPGAVLGSCQVKLQLWMWSSRRARMGVHMKWRTNRGLGGISLDSIRIDYWKDEPMDLYREGFVEMDPPHYLNSYPGLPADCRHTDPCADNHDGRGTFACSPGTFYRIRLTIKYFYNQGAGAGEIQLLEAETQMGCAYR
jgi:RHS repeat-associated protein